MLHYIAGQKSAQTCEGIIWLIFSRSLKISPGTRPCSVRPLMPRSALRGIRTVRCLSMCEWQKPDDSQAVSCVSALWHQPRDLLSGTGQVQQWHTRTHRQSPRPYLLSVASPSRYSGECCAHTHLAVCQLCFLLSLTYLTLFTLIDSVRMAFDISCWWGRWRTVKEKCGYFLP